MKIKYVHYALQNGYLDHWLLAGPQAFRVEDGPSAEHKSPEKIASLYDDPELHIQELPVERGAVTDGLFQVGDFSGSWDYYACSEDHRADQTAFFSERVFLRSWAFTSLYSKEQQEAALEISSLGPVRVWLNDSPVYHHDHFSGASPDRFTVPIVLQSGLNPLFIRFENVAQGHSAHYFTARACQSGSTDPLANVEMRIPSLIKTIGRRDRLERVFHSLYTDRDVYGWDQQIKLRWPPSAKPGQKVQPAFCKVRLQDSLGHIHAEAEVDGTPDDTLILGMAAQYPEDAYNIFLMPKPFEYYDHGLRITHTIPIYNLGRRQYSETRMGTDESRKQETLEYAARLDQGSVEREMSRMALGRWDLVEEAVLTAAVERAARGQSGSLLDWMALLALVARYGGQDLFPKSVQEAVQKTALGCRYPDDATRLTGAVCKVLAGQLYAEQLFFGGGLKGAELRAQGEEQALAWMRQQAAWGFADWGAEQGYAEALAGLAYLVDLAEAESVWSLAGAVMDKLFFTIALNSFKGIYGGASRRVRALSLKGGELSALSAVARLMWGQGVLSPQLQALVSLACCQNYQLPSMLAEIAGNPPEEMWSKERQSGSNAAQGANLAAYKTPDYLLASAQSYCPGEQGQGEQVWQATLGPGALVFTNHPGSSGDSESHLPGFWRGNGILPRAAQWKDALLCIYDVPETASLGFTHAFFPTSAFDEYVLKKGWAFARKGSAYLALSAANGLTLVQRGPYAYRELRSAGRQNAWACQMGRAARDGDFAAFQAKVLAQPFEFATGIARLTTLGGDRLELDWQGPFTVNQIEQPLSGFHHYENLYTVVDFPCTSMTLQVGEDALRLNLE